jgi:hypothetical protein
VLCGRWQPRLGSAIGIALVDHVEIGTYEGNVSVTRHVSSAQLSAHDGKLTHGPRKSRRNDCRQT